jgi:uridine kinase
MIISIIGHQGCGKSTLVKKIVKEFSKPHLYYDYDDVNLDSVPVLQDVIYIFDDAYNYLSGEYKDSNLVQDMLKVIAARRHNRLIIIFVFASPEQFPKFLYPMNNIMYIFPNTSGNFALHKSFPKYAKINEAIKLNKPELLKFKTN